MVKRSTDTETFCILPWIHLMMHPNGRFFSCCVSTSKEHLSSIDLEIDEAINSEKFNQLRVDMLQGKKNTNCENCYKAEKFNGSSFRKTSNDYFKHYINDVLDNTNQDGSIKEFKMRYFDLRMSNICNFKCRTCNSGYSSNFAKEEFKLLNKKQNIIIKPKKESNYKHKILNNLDNLEIIYFSGGEPLITEEHYTVLEELLKKDKTDVFLRYNTNLSNFKYKNKDILDLWKRFKSVEICASVDHYGKKAEYLRTGTIWEDIESNIFKIKDISHIKFGFNAVVSVFNYPSFGDFLIYMIDKSIYNKYTAPYTSFNISYDPEYFDPIILPKSLKQTGKDKLINAIEYGKLKGIDQSKNLLSIINYIDSDDKWIDYKRQFWIKANTFDIIRKEKLIEVFPELKEMINYENN